MSRVKIRYNASLYSLGQLPISLDHLNFLSKSVLSIENDLIFSYIDSDNDKITLTTSESLQEALSISPILILEVTSQCSQFVHPTEKDQKFEIRKCINALKSIFTIVIGNRTVGIGVLTNSRLALTSLKALPSIEIAKSAFALFENNSFQYNFDPDSCWICIEDLVLTAFSAPFSLLELFPIKINSALVPKDHDLIYTLSHPIKNNIKDRIKRLSIREVIGDFIYFDSISSCGPSGSPVFNTEWDLIGIQTTECQGKNTAIRSSELYEKLKIQPQTPILQIFLEEIKPILPQIQSELYENSLPTIDQWGHPFVYGINTTADKIIQFDPTSLKSNFFQLEEKQSEGYSLCSLPFGICLSGGKSSLRKAWIYFISPSIPCKSFRIDIPEAYFTHASICMFPNVLLIGGKNETGAQRTCYCLDVRTKNWTVFHSLNECRSYPAICEINQVVYVFGGCDESDLASIEVLNTNGWGYFNVTLPVALHGIAVLVIDEKKVLVCGGASEKIKSSDKVYRLDLTGKKYSAFTASQNIGRVSSTSVLDFHNNLYVYNSLGELIHYEKNSGTIKKYSRPMIT